MVSALGASNNRCHSKFTLIYNRRSSYINVEIMSSRKALHSLFLQNVITIKLEKISSILWFDLTIHYQA